MIMMWPCKVCKIPSTSPDGCVRHRPPSDPDETFEDELIRAMCEPVTRDDGFLISGMTFPSDSDL